MAIATIFVLSTFAVFTAQTEVTLMADRPYLSVPVSHLAELKCCCESNGNTVTSSWFKVTESVNKTFIKENKSTPVTVVANATESKKICDTLSLKNVTMNDHGFYQCWMNTSNSNQQSHGTYLRVYIPLGKTLNLSENTKNKILTAEGILLLLCVMLPSLSLIFKSKKIQRLEKKQMKREEENIYEGLNLEDCCATYDQIERSQAQSQYQDVCNIIEEEEEIQLEKP